MNRAKLTELEGKILLVLDFTSLTFPQEFELVIAEAEALRQTLPKRQKKNFLLIADFSYARFSPEVYDIMARYGRLASASSHTHAVVGLRSTSLIRVILRTYTGKEATIFSSVQAAKSWMCKEMSTK